METNNPDCPCKRIQCERHGNCKACREHHRALPKLTTTTCERIAIRKEKRMAQKAVIKDNTTKDNEKDTT